MNILLFCYDEYLKKTKIKMFKDSMELLFNRQSIILSPFIYTTNTIKLYNIMM